MDNMESSRGGCERKETKAEALQAQINRAVDNLEATVRQFIEKCDEEAGLNSQETSPPVHPSLVAMLDEYPSRIVNRLENLRLQLDTLLDHLV
jgi:hypothetical protein